MATAHKAKTATKATGEAAAAAFRTFVYRHVEKMLCGLGRKAKANLAADDALADRKPARTALAYIEALRGKLKAGDAVGAAYYGIQVGGLAVVLDSWKLANKEIKRRAGNSASTKRKAFYAAYDAAVESKPDAPQKDFITAAIRQCSEAGLTITRRNAKEYLRVRRKGTKAKNLGQG
jgi:hypothetical protein